MENEKIDSKIRTTALFHYSRKEIQNAIYEFCKNRETIPNYNNEFFGKRPDSIEYPSDIINLVKSGATSFHCSEELWSNPLAITTGLSQEEYNKLRIGWDLLIDIDSKYLDYGKIAAKLLINELEKHKIKNYSIKFSGSKGFHILVPFGAFPEELKGQKTKEMFPKWPRAIANYLLERIKEPMNKEILKIEKKEKLEKKGELLTQIICPICKNPSEKVEISVYVCENPKCKSVLESTKSTKKEIKCPSCGSKMIKKETKESFFCQNCNITNKSIEARGSIFGGEKRNPNKSFLKKDIIKSTQDSVDIVLVSPRHLFRAPYSLHEKTSLVSIPLKKEEIDEFDPKDANPLKIKEIRNFMPKAEKNEAKTLLLEAIEWEIENYKKKETPKNKESFEPINIKGLSISEEMFPNSIKKILEGIKNDGRKRALSILLPFYTSLGFQKDYIENKVSEWNNKNYQPLKEGYIKSQIEWHIKNKRLPPNYDKPIYKELGILSKEEQEFKNPINYAIKRAIREKSRINN